MQRLFEDLPEAIENTRLIAERCRVVLDRRSLPGERTDDIVAEIRECATRALAGTGARVKVAVQMAKPASEIATRAGISTPVPDETGDVLTRLDEMSDRLQRLERMMVELKTLILTPRG